MIRIVKRQPRSERLKRLVTFASAQTNKRRRDRGVKIMKRIEKVNQQLLFIISHSRTEKRTIN